MSKSVKWIYIGNAIDYYWLQFRENYFKSVNWLPDKTINNMSILKVRMYASSFQSAKKKEKISNRRYQFNCLVSWSFCNMGSNHLWILSLKDIPTSMISQDICEFQLWIEWDTRAIPSSKWLCDKTFCPIWFFKIFSMKLLKASQTTL